MFMRLGASTQPQVQTFEPTLAVLPSFAPDASSSATLPDAQSPVPSPAVQTVGDVNVEPAPQLDESDAPQGAPSGQDLPLDWTSDQSENMVDTEIIVRTNESNLERSVERLQEFTVPPEGMIQ